MKFKDIIESLPENKREEAKKYNKQLSILIYSFMGLSFAVIIGLGITSYLEGCR